MCCPEIVTLRIDTNFVTVYNCYIDIKLCNMAFDLPNDEFEEDAYDQSKRGQYQYRFRG